MGRIIEANFGASSKDYNPDLNHFLKEAKKSRLKEWLDQEKIFVTNELSKSIEEICFALASEEKLFDTEIFICISYVAKLIEEYIREQNIHMTVSDFLLSHKSNNSPEDIKKAANICFLICSIFQGRKSWRLMDENFYGSFGPMLYRIYYHKTKKEFAYLMQIHFKTVTDITAKAIAVS